MAYGDFDLKTAVNTFGLTEDRDTDVFLDCLYFFLGWQTSLELARILSYRLAPPSQSTQTIGKTVVRAAFPVKFAILVFFARQSVQ